jgi:hypothetical protein
MSWVENPEFQIFLKECRLAGYYIVDEYAKRNPEIYGVLVYVERGGYAAAVGEEPDGWTTWDMFSRGLDHFDSLEEALIDLEQRLQKKGES